MDAVTDYYGCGIDYIVEEIISRLNCEYRKGYNPEQENNKKVIREIYKFLSVLQQSIINSKQNHNFANKYLLYDSYLDFKAFTQSTEYQETKELSQLGAIHVLTRHITEGLRMICLFCDKLLEDIAADDWPTQVKNN